MKVPEAWKSWRTIAAQKKEPKIINKLIEAGIKLRDKRKALEAEAEAWGKEERALKDFLIENFSNDDLREVVTPAGKAKLTFKTIPTVDTTTGGWDAIWKYVAKTKAFDILQKRLHEGACKERWEAGEQIPGVTKFIKKDLRLGDAE